MKETVLLGHGSGGTMMKQIIDSVFFKAYGNDDLFEGNDAARLPLIFDTSIKAQQTNALNKSIKCSTQDLRIAFSTDSFVVTPHFFPGGDIGKLAICGTVNDVATSGAIPKYLSCGFILEEGFPIAELERICQSMAIAAKEAEVKVVTGDTKVVNRGHGDGVFINTSGIGFITNGLDLSGTNCKAGDKILISGTLGDHGITIMSCREELSFSVDIQSDAAPLNHLIQSVIHAAPHVRCFRDPTRGGIASTLNELAEQSNIDFKVDEASIPVKDAVRGACEMLGYDVFQVANEGKMICVVPSDEADAALKAMRNDQYGKEAAIIGEVVEKPQDRSPRVTLRTEFGSYRIMDMLVGEQLPRIC